MSSSEVENIDELIKILPQRVLRNDGAQILNQIFKGFQGNSSLLTTKGVEVIEIVLKAMRKQSTSLTHCRDVVSRLCIEIPKFPVEQVVKWSDDTIESIVADNDVNMIWRDILPECISVIREYEVIKHLEVDVTSIAYKEQCIKTLCQCKWNDKQLVQLAAMFKDMQLSREDHKLVVEKLCSCVIDLPPDTLPPFLHQLLGLCKLYDLDMVLSSLSHYFSLRLYSKLEPPQQDSESTSIDMDDIVEYNPSELSVCLSTCIYHVNQGAIEPEIIQKHIKAWPKTQLLRSPFIIDLALALSTKGADFRTTCLNVIRSAIEQRITDEQRSLESAWVRSVLPPDVNISDMFKVLTTESANHRDLTVMGLINLSFVLLGVARNRGSVCSMYWSLGKLVLVRLCKAQPEVAHYVLSKMTDKIAADSTHTQYAECLHVLCKLSPVSIERCSEVVSLVECCQPRGDNYRAAAEVLDALHPLLNFSIKTRDIIIMCCRKGLYSRESVHRCLSLSGLLSVLRHVRVGTGASSLSSQSCWSEPQTSSYFTQLTVDLHATNQGQVVKSRFRNETMCLEVVSILRRCFGQDAAVRQLYYNKIYDSVKDKPGLQEPICEQFYEHLSKYLSEEDSSLLIDKCIQVTETNAVLQEPIGSLLFAIAQLVQPTIEEELEDILSSQAEDSSAIHLKNKMLSILEQLSTNTLPEILMGGVGLTDLTVESMSKCIKVQLTLQCYEALIAHQMMQWKVNSNNAPTILNLIKSWNRLLEQAKTPSKPTKRSKATANETTQKTQDKLSNLLKNRTRPFKPLPTVWNLKFCLNVMDLFYSEELPLSRVQQYKQVRESSEAHRWAWGCLRASLESQTLDKRAIYTHVSRLAGFIYRQCVQKFQTLKVFDDKTALACIETFKECLTLLFSTNYSFNMDKILPIITDVKEEQPTSSHIAAILRSLLSALTQIEDVEGGSDAFSRKLIVALQTTASILLEVAVDTGPVITAVVGEFEEYVCTNKRECTNLVSALLTASCRCRQEASLLDDLLKKLVAVLGAIGDEQCTVPVSEKFPWMEERNSQTVLGHACSHLLARLRSVEHVLTRARDLVTAKRYVHSAHAHRIEREVLESYEAVVTELSQMSVWCACVARVPCAAGGVSERVAQTLDRLYTTLASLAAHTPLHLPAQIKFESLLKVSGKSLSSVTNDFIHYFEGIQDTKKTTKVLPKLVMAVENYSKNVLVLGKRTKINYQQYLSLGHGRDFRITVPVERQSLSPVESANDINEESPTPSDTDGEGNEDTKKRRKLIN